MRKSIVALACLTVALTLSQSASALELAPFPTRNMNPLAQIFGLPAAAPGRVTSPGRTESALTADVASHFTEDSSTDETIFLDGETYRFGLSVRHGLREGVEVGAEVPYLLHRGGFLDNFTVGWHDFFGLPQSGRDDYPHNLLLFRYSDHGEERLRLEDGTDGLGDIRLTAGWQVLSSETGAAALRASLKLPTGDSDRLLGSGSTDLALWLSGERTFVGGGEELALFGGAGGLLLTDGDILPDRQRNAVGFGTLGGAWRALPWLAFKIQVDGHTAFFDSDLPQLDDSLQLTLGGTLDWGATTFDLGVVEDIAVDTAPDVTFLLALRRAF